MSPQHNAYQAYSQAFNTVSKTRQIVMLYDGMIRFMSQAKDAIEDNRIEDRYNLLTKVSEVIMGLQSSLDFESGGNVAQALYDFYSMLDGKIIQIHRSNSSAECDEVIAEIKDMRSAWEVIDHGESESNTQSSQAMEPQPAAMQNGYGQIAIPSQSPQTASSFSSDVTA